MVKTGKLLYHGPLTGVPDAVILIFDNDAYDAYRSLFENAITCFFP